MVLSLSGEQGPAAGAQLVDPTQLTAIGRAVLATISALDSGTTLPPPSAYVLLGGKVVPGWAISLFVLALLVPVMLTTVDGVARARRRGHIIWRSLTVVLAAAVPFVLLVGLVLLARPAGVITVAPPGPVAAGAIPLTGGGVALLVVMALVVVGGIGRRAGPGPAAAHPDPRVTAAPEGLGSDGAMAGLLVVMCVVTFVIWLSNPFAAFLLVPALHLWLWAVSPDPRVPVAAAARAPRRRPRAGGARGGYYANELGYGPLNVVWEMVLLIAGHGVSIASAVEWSVVLGCLLTAVDARRCSPPVARARCRPGHRPRPGHLRRSRFAGRHQVGAAPLVAPVCDALIRDISSVLILSGLLLVLDAGVTLVWQEPVTAAIGVIMRGQVNQRYLSYRTAPLTGSDVQALHTIKPLGQRIAFLARRERAQVTTGDAIGQIAIPRIGSTLQRRPGRPTSRAWRRARPLPADRAARAWARRWPSPGTGPPTWRRFGSSTSSSAGDQIIVKMPYGRFTYVVQYQRIVLPTALWVIDDVGYDRLVLSACNPLYSAAQRIIIFARLKSVEPSGPAAERGLMRRSASCAGFHTDVQMSSPRASAWRSKARAPTLKASD